MTTTAFGSPRAATAADTGIRDGEQYVAWTGFVCAAGHVAAGETVDSDDARLRLVPGNFVSVTVPESKRPNVYDRVIAENKARVEAEAARRRAAFESEARRNKMKLTVRKLKALTEFFALVDGKPTLVQKGSEVVAGDPLVARHPEAFGL